MLELTRISAFYGQAQALFDVSINLRAGEMVVLQGLNGAGKSTLLKTIMGLEVRSVGDITFTPVAASGPVRIDGWETHRRAGLGLGYVAEDRRLFTGLTVRDNLWVAARHQPTEGVKAGPALEAQVLDLFPALKTMLKRAASQMSGGEQQMLAIARTLMTSPTLLLLDEPCEGISPVLVESITRALLALRADGMPMLVAEQNHLLADHADRLMVLVAGKVRDG